MKGLFACLEFFVPLENFSLICRWWAANSDLCLALMDIEQWGFFSVPHLLWYGTSVYDNPWNSERLAVELSLPCFNDVGLSRLGFEHPTFRLHVVGVISNFNISSSEPWNGMLYKFLLLLHGLNIADTA